MAETRSSGRWHAARQAGGRDPADVTRIQKLSPADHTGADTSPGIAWRVSAWPPEAVVRLSESRVRPMHEGEYLSAVTALAGPGSYGYCIEADREAARGIVFQSRWLPSSGPYPGDGTAGVYGGLVREVTG